MTVDGVTDIRHARGLPVYTMGTASVQVRVILKPPHAMQQQPSEEGIVLRHHGLCVESIEKAGAQGATFAAGPSLGIESGMCLLCQAAAGLVCGRSFC